MYFLRFLVPTEQDAHRDKMAIGYSLLRFLFQAHKATSFFIFSP